MEIIKNHKKNKEVRSKIFKIIKSLHKDGLTFEDISKTLNSDGYRCCDGKEWKSKSVYDFFRRENLRAQISVKDIGSQYILNKDIILKALVECDMDSSIKMEIIKRIV